MTPLSLFVIPHCINQYLSSSSAHPHLASKQHADRCLWHQTHAVLSVIKTLAVELLARARTAVLLGHPQICGLVIWSPGLAGGWRDFGLTVEMKCCFTVIRGCCCSSWESADACRRPQPLTWLKLSPLIRAPCICIWALEYVLQTVHIRYLSDNNLSMHEALCAFVCGWLKFHGRYMSAQACMHPCVCQAGVLNQDSPHCLRCKRTTPQPKKVRQSVWTAVGLARWDGGVRLNRRGR